MFEQIGLPLRLAAGAATPQLHYLISLAAGSTETVGGPITHGLMLDGKCSVEAVVMNVQFVHRLIGWFEERGVEILCQINAFNGNISPPSLLVANVLIDSLLAVEQGVRNLSVRYSLNHHIVQDVAAMWVQRKLSQEYLERFGYKVNLTQGCDHWKGRFPQDRDKAHALICLGTAIAKWGGASQIMIKSTEEGFGVATKEAHAAGLKSTRQMLNLLAKQEFPFAQSEEFQAESHMIELETRLIMDRVLELGDGDVAVGLEKAVEAGAFEIPYGANMHNLGKVLVVRDSTGAVRYLDSGNLPFTQEIVQFHKEKVAARAKAESKKEYELVIEDLICEL